MINGLGVTPTEADSDFEIADAVRLVLEKDPFVNADQLRVGVRNAIVALDGVVPTEAGATWPSTMRGMSLVSRTSSTVSR